MSTGNIQLSEIESEGLVATGAISLVPQTEELHLLGQHDQESHGRPLGGKNAGALRSVADVERNRLRREAINERIHGKKGAAVLDKAERDLEKVRDDAYDNFQKADGIKELREALTEFNQADKDLRSVRKKIYSPDELDRLDSAEEVSQFFKANAAEIRQSGNKLTKDISEGSGKYWADEVTRAKKEARGQKTQKLNQSLGKTLKNGEWPDPAGLIDSKDSTRPIRTVKDAGLLGKVEVDGIQVKRAYEITAHDGSKLRMYDVAPGPFKGQKREEMLNAMAYMHELYPQTPPRKMVLVNNLQASVMAGPGVQAFVYPGADYIFMNKGSVNKMGKGGVFGKNWFMPNAKNVSGTEYTLTHEYGHQYDAQNKRSAARGLFENNNVKQHLSTYGKSQAAEGYAEAFAEWHTSRGQTDNPAAIAYARHENWYGHQSAQRIVRTPEGAKLYGVSIGQPIRPMEAAAWDPWEIASEMGIITMASGDEEDIVFDKKLFEKIPVITENWETGKSEYRNYKSPAATQAEKDEAERVIREVWAELGLEYED